MISAFGKMMGSFFQLMTISNSCPQKYPEMKASFGTGFKDYVNRNKFLENAKNNLYKRAKKEGGKAAVTRLQTEISGAEALRGRVEKFAKGLSRNQCRDYFSKMVKGELDLKITYPKEAKLLVGN